MPNMKVLVSSSNVSETLQLELACLHRKLLAKYLNLVPIVLKCCYIRDVCMRAFTGIFLEVCCMIAKRNMVAGGNTHTRQTNSYK